jgi:hypothetical protein
MHGSFLPNRSRYVRDLLRQKSRGVGRRRVSASHSRNSQEDSRNYQNLQFHLRYVKTTQSRYAFLLKTFKHRGRVHLHLADKLVQRIMSGRLVIFLPVMVLILKVMFSRYAKVRSNALFNQMPCLLTQMQCCLNIKI